MTELMSREMQELFYMFFGGIAVMLLFSVRTQLCTRCRQYQRLRRFLYLIFWVFGGFLFYQFAYKGAYGLVSWYSLLAFGAGIILWKKIFCDIMTLYDTAQKQIGDLKHEKKKKRTHTKIRGKKSKK